MVWLMRAQCSQIHNRPLPLTPSLTRVHTGTDTGSELFEPLIPPSLIESI